MSAHPTGTAGLTIGMEASRRVSFTTEVVAIFADLVGDHAPVHFSDEFARAEGYSSPIVHGFLLGSGFSGLLGETLPGPHSVINLVSLKMHCPVMVGEEVRYLARVEQISVAVGAVVLALSVLNATGETVMSGKVTCSFPPKV